jgi:hypothetical protein
MRTTNGFISSEFSYKHAPNLSIEELFGLARVRFHGALPLVISLITLSAVAECRLLDKEDMEKPRFRQVNWLLKYDTDPKLLIGQNIVNELQFTTHLES